MFVHLRYLVRIFGAIVIRDREEVVITGESKTIIRTVKELMGHADIRTTQIYLHVMKKPGLGVKSPLDGLGMKSPLDGLDHEPRPPSRA